MDARYHKENEEHLKDYDDCFAVRSLLRKERSRSK
jgi:hypothetical protein